MEWDRIWNDKGLKVLGHYMQNGMSEKTADENRVIKYREIVS
jgi:hypothetical protein